MSVRSFDDYHKMLAEKIWKIQKQLDEQRQVKDWIKTIWGCLLSKST